MGVPAGLGDLRSRCVICLDVLLQSPLLVPSGTLANPGRDLVRERFLSYSSDKEQQKRLADPSSGLPSWAAKDAGGTTL